MNSQAATTLTLTDHEGTVLSVDEQYLAAYQQGQGQRRLTRVRPRCVKSQTDPDHGR